MITGSVQESLPYDMLSQVLPLIDELKSSFSDVELSRLFFIHDIIVHDSEFIIKALIRYKPTRFSGAAYHTSSRCRELNKNFIDVHWDISDRSKVKALEHALSKEYENIVYNEIHDREVALPIPENIKVKYNAYTAKVVLRKNSGHLTFFNYSKSDVIERIKKILYESNEFRYLSGKDITNEIDKYTYGTDRWSVIKDKPVMKKWKEYKDEIVDLIIIYYRMSSKGEVSQNLLDTLNLKPCQSCKLNNLIPF